MSVDAGQGLKNTSDAPSLTVSIIADLNGKGASHREGSLDAAHLANMTALPPAIVVGAQVNGLGVVRSLARARLPIITLDTTLAQPAMWSRSSQRVVVPKLSGRSFVDSLLNLQKRLGSRPVLILTDEMAVTTVSEYRDELRHAYSFQLPSRELLATLENKARFHEFAERHWLPVPLTVVLKDNGDLAQLSRLQCPLIIKPADKVSVHLGRTQRLAQANTPEEGLALCREMLRTAGELVVQEWISGPDSSIYFSLFHSGKDPAAVSIFHGRKVSSYPPGIGSTAVCMAAPEAAEALRPLTERFLALTDYEGLGSLEFKWDARACRFVIIEPTVGRTDWQEEIAALSGVNLPLSAYRHAAGLPHLAPAGATHPVAWRESFRHRGRMTELPAGIQIYDGYWRSNDPLPAVVYYSKFILRKLRRGIARRLGQRKELIPRKAGGLA
jgi:D-aspartate ligase